MVERLIMVVWLKLGLMIECIVKRSREGYICILVALYVIINGHLQCLLIYFGPSCHQTRLRKRPSPCIINIRHYDGRLGEVVTRYSYKHVAHDILSKSVDGVIIFEHHNERLEEKETFEELIIMI